MELKTPFPLHTFTYALLSLWSCHHVPAASAGPQSAHVTSLTHDGLPRLHPPAFCHPYTAGLHGGNASHLRDMIQRG